MRSARTEPRRSTENVAVTIAVGIISAADIPCTRRAIISIAMSCDTAARLVAAKNVAAKTEHVAEMTADHRERCKSDEAGCKDPLA